MQLGAILSQKLDNCCATLRIVYRPQWSFAKLRDGPCLGCFLDMHKVQIIKGNTSGGKHDF
jgi:hypothetical protein